MAILNREKPICDWLFFTGLVIVPAGIGLIYLGGFLTYIGLILLVVLALMDLLGWRDTRNYSFANDQQLSKIKYYRYFSWWQVMSVFVFLGVCGYLFCQADVSNFEQIGLLISSGLCSGAIGITQAHELIHRSNRAERLFGGLSLSANCYATFKIEHIRGHHRNVATEHDASSAQLGQSLYHFLPRAVFGNIRSAIKLEAQRLNNLGFNALSWRNELIGWSLLSLALTLTPALYFGYFWILFFLTQSLIAILVLETTNYVEHYGLKRNQLANGSLERVNIKHSWNSSALITNYFFINLQRHADHHVDPQRRYQNLRHHDASPQLPTGYAGMFLSALVPPVWRALMDWRALEFIKLQQACESNNNDDHVGISIVLESAECKV